MALVSLHGTVDPTGVLAATGCPFNVYTGAPRDVEMDNIPMTTPMTSSTVIELTRLQSGLDTLALFACRPRQSTQFQIGCPAWGPAAYGVKEHERGGERRRVGVWEREQCWRWG